MDGRRERPSSVPQSALYIMPKFRVHNSLAYARTGPLEFPENFKGPVLAYAGELDIRVFARGGRAVRGIFRVHLGLETGRVAATIPVESLKCPHKRGGISEIHYTGKIRVPFHPACNGG